MIFPNFYEVTLVVDKQLYKYKNCKRMDILIKLYEEVSDVYNC